MEGWKYIDINEKMNNNVQSQVSRKVQLEGDTYMIGEIELWYNLIDLWQIDSSPPCLTST